MAHQYNISVLPNANVSTEARQSIPRGWDRGASAELGNRIIVRMQIRITFAGNCPRCPNAFRDSYPQEPGKRIRSPKSVLIAAQLDLNSSFGKHTVNLQTMISNGKHPVSQSHISRPSTWRLAAHISNFVHLPRGQQKTQLLEHRPISLRKQNALVPSLYRNWTKIELAFDRSQKAHLLF